MFNKTFYAIFATCLLTSSITASHAKEVPLNLGASPFETYINNEGESSRLTNLINAIFDEMEQEARLNVMRPAFLGSALRSGKVDGQFAFIALGNQDNGFVYSDPYLPIRLYAVSKKDNVSQIKIMPHLQDARVAIENRFANTPTFRTFSEVKWSRNPSTFDAFRQLADDRAPYLLTTQLLLNEFNKLLAQKGEGPLYQSILPPVETSFHISLSQKRQDADVIIDKFNAAIATLQQNGTYNRTLNIPWFTKDINDDGVADYIGSLSVSTPSTEVTFALDNNKTGSDSVFVIDGTIYENKSQLSTLDLSEAPTSALDPILYERMIERW